jgi:hypothetical protein
MKAQRMMMWRMTHICHLSGLVLMAKDWQVLVVARHEENEEEDDGNDGLRVIMIRRMKIFWCWGDQPHLLHSHGNSNFPATSESRLEGEDQLQGQDRLGDGKEKKNPRLVEMEPGTDYRFHTTFQQDFYESVIITKTEPLAIS